MAFAACILLAVAGLLHAQHGEAGNGYFPIGYARDTWTGEVSAVNDDTREITLVYNGAGKTETFVGVLQQGTNKARLKDGSLAEVKVSLIHIGSLFAYTQRRSARHSPVASTAPLAL
jgi:hypothetical protein